MLTQPRLGKGAEGSEWDPSRYNSGDYPFHDVSPIIYTD